MRATWLVVLSSIFVIAEHGIAAGLSPSGPGKEMSRAPMKSAKTCQNSKSQLETCQQKADALAPEDVCHTNKTTGSGPSGTSSNRSGRVNSARQREANGIARWLQGRCQKAVQECRDACSEDKISSCTNDERNQSEVDNAKEAMRTASKHCEKGQAYADAAGQQADANDQAGNQSDEQNEKNKEGGGGGMPQMPQMPQGGGDSPQQASQTPMDPPAPPDPCLANPRGCIKSEPSPTVALGAATSTGENLEESPMDDSGSIGDSNAPFFPSMTGDAGGEAGGMMAGAGGMGGGAANAAAAKPEDKKEKRGLATVNAGTDGGGGGGGGGGYSGDDDDDDKKKAKRGFGRPLFASGSAKAAGFTSAGGRTNWEKVKLRYRDNQPTLLREEREAAAAAAPIKKDIKK